MVGQIGALATVDDDDLVGATALVNGRDGRGRILGHCGSRRRRVLLLQAARARVLEQH